VQGISHTSDTTQPTQEILEALQQLSQVQQARQSATPSTTGTPNGNVVKEESLLDSGDPPSEWDSLRAQLREKPHDPEGWNRLANLAENSDDLEKVRKTYEALLEMYPNTVSTISPFHDDLGEITTTSVLGANSFSRTFHDTWSFQICRRLVQDFFANITLCRPMEILSNICQVRVFGLRVLNMGAQRMSSVT